MSGRSTRNRGQISYAEDFKMEDEDDFDEEDQGPAQSKRALRIKLKTNGRETDDNVSRKNSSASSKHQSGTTVENRQSSIRRSSRRMSQTIDSPDSAEPEERLGKHKQRIARAADHEEEGKEARPTRSSSRLHTLPSTSALKSASTSQHGKRYDLVQQPQISNLRRSARVSSSDRTLVSSDENHSPVKKRTRFTDTIESEVRKNIPSPSLFSLLDFLLSIFCNMIADTYLFSLSS